MVAVGEDGRHTNMVSANLLQQYTPVVSVEEVLELEEDVEAVSEEPQTKLPEWSLMPNKVNYRRPA